MAAKKINKYTGMILVITFFVLFVVNALVIHFAQAFFPDYLALGTYSITRSWAIVFSMGALALVNTFALPFIREYENRRGKMLTNREWMAYYFVLNAAGIWVLARFADQFGLGISSWRVAVALAVVLDVVQGFAMMQVEKLRTKK